MENYTRKQVNKNCDEFYYNSKKQLHRLDGPAVEDSNGGYKAWFINGKRHREDGPAITRLYGDKEWWINGKKYSKSYYCSLCLFSALEPKKIDLNPME